MAENQLAVITLPSDAGSGFEPGGLSAYTGDKIYIYWDDVNSVFITKLEANTGTEDGNIGIWGDSGNFETVETGWLNSEQAKGVINGYLVRSATVAHAGTYSARLTSPSTTYTNLIHQRASSVTAGKIYKITCWVYVPSGTPLAASGKITFYNNPLSGGDVADIVSTSIALATDTWQQISCRYSAYFAENPIVSIKLSGGTAITNGLIYFDEFYIKEDTGFTTVTTTLTDGPILPVLTAADVNNGGGTVQTKGWWSVYSFCSGSTLNNFKGYFKAAEFPYAIRDQYANHFSCTTPIGNTIVLTLLSVTEASSQFDQDGAFEVEATSQGGAIVFKISQDQPVYPDGQVSGVFSSLLPGTYTVWAVDELQYGRSLVVNIPYGISNEPQPTATNNYYEKYRMDYTDIENVVTRRVSIWERNFNGTYVEVTGGETPFVRSYGGSDGVGDKFESIRKTQAQIEFVSQRDMQFIGMFSQDDRKFQVRYSNPVGTELWRGLVVPSVFSEPYTEAPPYITVINATCGLVELEDDDFLDRDGNYYEGLQSLIVIVANILDRLDLALGIRVAANISEETHNGVKPFEETYYDQDSFYDEKNTPWKCERVLRAIIEPFGAKLIQEDGYWNIVRIEEQTATYNTRIYDSAGVFVSTGTKNPIMDISTPSLKINAAFVNADHVLQVQPAYGEITINHKLFPKVSVLKGYSFEDNESHTLDWDNQAQEFEGWSIDKTTFNGSNISVLPSPVQLKNSSGNYALEAKGMDVLSNFSTGGSYVTLSSDFSTWQYSGADSFSLSFNFRINVIPPDALDPFTPSFSGPAFWSRLRYQIKKGIYYFSKDWGWVIPGVNDEDVKWNNVWVTPEDYNKVLTEEINNAYLTNPNLSTLTSHPVSASFILEGRDTSDAQSEAELAAIITTTKQVGYKIKVGDGTYGYMYFILREGTTATSWPDIKRPTDYATTTNEVYWELEYRTLVSSPPLQVYSVMLDDVLLKFLPNYKEPPDSEELNVVINKNFKETLNVDLDGGDIPDIQINNRKYLYETIFYDQDGQPTDTWGREAFSTEATTIQNILLKSLTNQYRWPTFKFSGSLIGFTDFGFLTTIKHTQTAASLSLTNEEFTGNSTGWTNSDAGTSWAYDSNDVKVTLSGATDSKIFGQALTGYAGQRISIAHSLIRTATSGIRGDWLICAMISGGNIVQEVVLDDNMIYDSTYSKIIKFSFDNDFDTIGFYIRNISGTGDATYDMEYFRLVPLNIVRYYTPNSMSINDKMNEYSGSWTQLIPVVFSSDPTVDDSGEGNTGSEGGGGSGTGGSGGDYNNDYNADYNI